jgi:predicted HTH domain antitoxin
MTLVIDIPPETEKLLQAEWGDLNQAAREALLIESYRRGKLSLGQCSEIFDKSIVETEAFFRSRGVDLPMSVEDLQQDCAILENLVK